MKKIKSPLIFWLVLAIIFAGSAAFFIMGLSRYRTAMVMRRTSSARVLTPYSSQIGAMIYLPSGWNVSRDDQGALVTKNPRGGVFSIYPAGSGMSESALQATFPLLKGILRNIIDRNCPANFPTPALQKISLASGPVYYYSLACTAKNGTPLGVMTLAWLSGTNAYSGGIFFRNPNTGVQNLTFAILSGDAAWLLQSGTQLPSSH